MVQKDSVSHQSHCFAPSVKLDNLRLLQKEGDIYLKTGNNAELNSIACKRAESQKDITQSEIVIITFIDGTRKDGP